MIGSWNNANVNAAWLPAAWKNGNGSANKYTGNFPGYPSADVAFAFTGFGAGEGYIAADGKIIVPGVNEIGVVDSAQSLWHADQAYSWEWIVRPQITLGASGIEVLNAFDDKSAGSHAMRLMFMDTAQYSTYKGLSLACGNNNSKYGYGTRATFHNVKYHIALTKAAGSLNVIGNWALYLNGSPVSLASYAGAAVVTDGVNYLFSNNPAGFFGEFELWAAIVYNRKLEAAEVAVNAGLGDDYGLVGNNVGDLMNLTAPGGIVNPMLNKKVLGAGTINTGALV